MTILSRTRRSYGLIYITSWDGNLYSIRPDGTLKWDFHTGGRAPLIGADGTVYVGAPDLFAINPDGTEKWKFIVDGGSHSTSGAIGIDGTIYIGAYRKLYAINPDGTLRWSFYMDERCSAPAIGEDGTIYVGSYHGIFYAINQDGTKKWSYTPGGYQVYQTPAIGENGIIYVGFNHKKFVAFDSNGSQIWEIIGDFCESRPSIANDGTIYVGNYDKNLYAIICNSLGLANSIWPKFHQNNKNTGRIQPPIANFLADTTLGFVPFTVRFKDSSSGLIIAHQWNFGDGQESTEQNPSHTYETANTFSVTLTVTGPGGIDTKIRENYIIVKDPSQPGKFHLAQNYPNPFNNVTTIEYQLPKDTQVTLRIFNIAGEFVKTLIEEKQTAYYYKIQWDGRDENGNSVAGGLYLYYLKADGFSQSNKMVLIR